jgi:hypothetical protein
MPGRPVLASAWPLNPAGTTSSKMANTRARSSGVVSMCCSPPQQLRDVVARLGVECDGADVHLAELQLGLIPWRMGFRMTKFNGSYSAQRKTSLQTRCSFRKDCMKAVSWQSGSRPIEVARETTSILGPDYNRLIPGMFYRFSPSTSY